VQRQIGPQIGDGEPVARTVVRIEPRGRLTLPDGFRSRFESGHALARLDEPGRLVLLPWDPDGLLAERRYAQLVSTDPIDDDVLERLIELTDRHERLRIEAVGRVALQATTLFHLGMDLGSRKNPASVYAREVVLWRLPSRLEVWSRRYRATRLRVSPDEPDVPVE
jgi:hypothetical protein